MRQLNRKGVVGLVGAARVVYAVAGLPGFFQVPFPDTFWVSVSDPELFAGSGSGIQILGLDSERIRNKNLDKKSIFFTIYKVRKFACQ